MSASTGQVDPRFPTISSSDQVSYLSHAASDGSGGWYVAGLFDRVAGRRCVGFAHNLASGRVDRRWCHAGIQAADSVVVTDSRVIVSGTFDANAIAGAGSRVFSLSTAELEQPLATRGPVVASCGRVVVAIDHAGERVGLAAFDVRTGRRLWRRAVPQQIISTAVAHGVVYVSEGYTDATQVAILSSYHCRSGSPAAWHPTIDATVSTLVASPIGILLLGAFSQVDGQPRAGIAAVDQTTGATLRAWVPQVQTTPNSSLVYGTLAADRHAIYVAGPFSAIDGTPRAGIAALSLDTGTPTTWQLTPWTTSHFTQIASDGTHVLVGVMNIPAPAT